MADQTTLRFIGVALGAITAAVTLMAAVAVMNVDRSLDPPAAAVLSTSTG
jgi:CBS-domain-containing membrane protein